MSEKLSAAYQLLNNANDSFVQAFKVLAQGIEYQKQAFELLRLREVLDAMPTAAPSLPTLTNDIPPAGQGCTVKFALWKGNNLSGSIEVSEQQHTAKYRCVLFNANPNDRGRVFNGSIVPENSRGGSLRENQVGGVFINLGEGGKYVISGNIEASVANNRIKFSGEVVANNAANSPRAPHLLAVCTSAERFFNDAASTALGQPITDTSNVEGNVVQQLASDNLLGGLVSAPGSPADPILPTSKAEPSFDDFFGGSAAPIEQASETLVDGSENDLRSLLG